MLENWIYENYADLIQDYKESFKDKYHISPDDVLRLAKTVTTAEGNALGIPELDAPLFDTLEPVETLEGNVAENVDTAESDRILADVRQLEDAGLDVTEENLRNFGPETQKFNQEQEVDVPLDSLSEKSRAELPDLYSRKPESVAHLSPEEIRKRQLRWGAKHGWYDRSTAGPSKQVTDKFTEVADAQRYGKPERIMNRLTMAYGGGEVPHLLEHVGDLTHRLAERADSWFGSAPGLALVRYKLQTAVRSLNNPNFKQIADEQLQRNGEVLVEDGKYPSVEAYKDKIARLSQEYADAHREIPTFNRVQKLAQRAAIALGERNWDDAKYAINLLDSALAHGDSSRVYADAVWQTGKLSFEDFLKEKLGDLNAALSAWAWRRARGRRHPGGDSA